jgi:hypothetical protein
MMQPHYIDPWEMRRRFNCGGYWKRVRNGQLIARPGKPRKPSPKSGQPASAQSLMVTYLDPNNEMVAKVHQFQLPDGTLTASRLPDPKVLFENGVLFHCFPPDKPPNLLRKIWGSINAVWGTVCRWVGR